MSNYSFGPLGLRAQCLQVVDACTIVCLVDRGFDDYKRVKLKLKDVDCPLPEVESSPTERSRNLEAIQWLREMMQPIMITDAALLGEWPLRVLIYNEKSDPTTWYADVWIHDPDNLKRELHLNQQLLELGLAKAAQRPL